MRIKGKTKQAEPVPVELQTHRTGYEFVRCGDRFGMSAGCGWCEPAPSGQAATMLRNHIDDCPFEAKELYVPMWSIAWPWYNSELEQEYRRGEGTGAPYGLEMSWRPVGSHTLRYSGLMSTMEKAWWLFAEMKQEEGL